MRPQFFPWLFDDKNAWEKAFSDPRYAYDMPMDYFMAIYQVERKYEVEGAVRLPELSMPMMPLPTAAAPSFASAPAFLATSAAMAPAAPKQEKSKSEEGILSQDEIDALLSGI
jgi:hypothetical protein